MDRQIIDKTKFEQLRETMGPGFINELIDIYLDDSTSLIIAIKTALMEGDPVIFQRSAHSLKSNSASLGAVTLSNMARELETAGKSGFIEDTHGKVEALYMEYTKVQKQLMEWRNESATSD